MYTYIHKYIYTYMAGFLGVAPELGRGRFIRDAARSLVCIFIYKYTYMCVCVCVCVYMYLYIYIYNNEKSYRRVLWLPKQRSGIQRGFLNNPEAGNPEG